MEKDQGIEIDGHAKSREEKKKCIKYAFLRRIFIIAARTRNFTPPTVLFT